MSAYDEYKKHIEEEKNLPPGERRWAVPCAFCVYGGNGRKTCGCGWNEKRYSKYRKCFSGELLKEKP